MGQILLLLLILMQSHAMFAESEQTLLGVCGLDRVGFVESSGGWYFIVNQKRLDGPDSVCRVLGFYFGSGCFSADTEWERIGKKYCNPAFGFSDDDFIRRAGRKLLLQPIKTASGPDVLNERGHAEEENTLMPDKLTLAIPGMFLLCCALMCPCFRTKKKDETEQNVMSRELNLMDAVANYEVNSGLEKSPATPFRIPPSPSRFAMSPQMNRFGSIHLNANQIIKATNNFSTSSKLGEGVFGTVYKATLPDGQIVAIKRAKKHCWLSIWRGLPFPSFCSWWIQCCCCSHAQPREPLSSCIPSERSRGTSPDSRQPRDTSFIREDENVQQVQLPRRLQIWGQLPFCPR